MILAFHPDLNNRALFQRRSRLDDLAYRLHREIRFAQSPRGWWLRGWSARDTLHVVKWVEKVIGDREDVTFVGYSDGATMALAAASIFSMQVKSVVSYAGRLWDPPSHTLIKFPVYSCWNGRDNRFNSPEHKRLIQIFQDLGHPVRSRVFNNRLTHWSGWDSVQNHQIAEMV